MPLDWVNRQNNVDFVQAEDVNALAAAIIENENQIANKQDILIFDTSPSLGSTNPVTSDGIQNSLDYKASISWVETQLNNKQDALIFDDIPTINSRNPVTSTGIKTALDVKADKLKSIPHTIVSGYPISLTDQLENEELISCRVYGAEGGVGDLAESGEHQGEYKITLLSCGKNLYNISDVMPQSSWNGYYCQTTYPAGTYTVSYDYPTQITASSIIAAADTDNQRIANIFIRPNVTETGRNSVTFTASKEWRLYVNVDGAPAYETQLKPLLFGSDGNSGIIRNIQIEQGETATEYESYIQKTATVYLNEPLYENDAVQMNFNAPDINYIKASTAVLPSKIEVGYYQDINKVLAELKAAILSQGGNV